MNKIYHFNIWNLLLGIVIVINYSYGPGQYVFLLILLNLEILFEIFKTTMSEQRQSKKLHISWPVKPNFNLAGKACKVVK